jgi:hypothetical protein
MHIGVFFMHTDVFFMHIGVFFMHTDVFFMHIGVFFMHTDVFFMHIGVFFMHTDVFFMHIGVFFMHTDVFFVHSGVFFIRTVVSCVLCTDLYFRVSILDNDVLCCSGVLRVYPAVEINITHELKYMHSDWFTKAMDHKGEGDIVLTTPRYDDFTGQNIVVTLMTNKYGPPT